MKNETIIPKIVPVMLAFFTMGFVDLSGIATNYVKSDFALSDTAANAFSIMVFLWFIIFSIPTGMLMNKIGRKKTVILSIFVTFIGLCIPVIAYNNIMMIFSFSFLGIGNTLMQVSLNPLLTNIVSDKKLPSFLTLGQFVKAIASFIAPIIVAQAVIRYGDWKLLFPIFATICLIAIIYLFFTEIKEHTIEGKPATFKECIALLGNQLVFLLFLGILVHVGVDVGINITAPKLLMENVGIPLSKAGYATSLYFLFRTFGCLAGIFILARFSPEKFFIVSVGIILLGIISLFFSHTLLSIYTCVALVGVGNSNVFPIILSKALIYMPDRKNDISGLMMMGISGGAVFPVLMGLASDQLGGQVGAVMVLTVCVLYLAFLITRFKMGHQ
ncbi:MAG: MFS transporter [Tannerellaceae bacterium]|jgi:fucose permease|nr:MFS transporter [Tannerellaceae bacterium]